MLTPEQIYSIVYKTDSGIQGYAMPRFYHDPVEMMKNRDLLKQIQTNQVHKRHETKRGNYLEDYTKVFKSFPGPNQYQHFEVTKPIEKKIKYGNRSTLFDQLQQEQKRLKQPPVGTYNVVKTQEQINAELKLLKTKKIKIGERPNPCEDAMAHSLLVPGPGNYNPHTILPKIKVNLTKPEDWRKKHKTEKSKSNSFLPPVGTYTPILIDSFSKIAISHPQKRPYWGGEKRFKGLFGSQVVSPGPGAYQGVSKIQTKGISKSVYYE